MPDDSDKDRIKAAAKKRVTMPDGRPAVLGRTPFAKASGAIKDFVQGTDKDRAEWHRKDWLHQKSNWETGHWVPNYTQQMEQRKMEAAQKERQENAKRR